MGLCFRSALKVDDLKQEAFQKGSEEKPESPSNVITTNSLSRLRANLGVSLPVTSIGFTERKKKNAASSSGTPFPHPGPET